MNEPAVQNEATVPSSSGKSMQALVAGLRDQHASGRTRSYEWRQRQLAGLARLLEECEQEICQALHEDLGRPDTEAYGADVAYVARELRMVRKRLRGWMKPRRVRTSLLAWPGSSRVYPEPFGVVLVIAPWNYPLQLALVPLLGAIAAGNCAVLKPSEVTPHMSELLARKLPNYVDPQCVKVVEGAVPEATALLAEPFDYIFYTGTTQVGRIVMTAAAKHLTPVTLELGGKSPCIVDEGVDLSLAAKRIVWGKFYNAGQTCVAPDYLLVHRNQYEPMLDALTQTIKEFYGDDPQQSPDYGRVVNGRHHRRLAGLLDGQKIVCGGQMDEADRYIAPTVVRDVAPSAPVMDDEIFGPILPVLPVSDLDEAIAFVNARPKPLALYLFSGNRAAQQAVVAQTSSGGVTFNHAWLHLLVPDLPFGGVGGSGMGAYHGRLTFDTFTHRKSVLNKSTLPDPPFLFPPYTDSKKRWLRRLL